MAYSTIDDVFARYRPINSIVGSADNQVRSLEVTSIFIAGADALIDGYASRRYSVPLPANPLITQISADLSIFNILVEHLPQVPDFMQKRYDRCMALLMDIASGMLSVTSAEPLTAEGDAYAWSTTQDYSHAIFSPVLGETEQRIPEDRYEQDLDKRLDDNT